MIQFMGQHSDDLTRYTPRVEVALDGSEFLVFVRGEDGLDRKILAVCERGVYRYVCPPMGIAADDDERIADWSPVSTTNPTDPGEPCRERAAAEIAARGGV